MYGFSVAGNCVHMNKYLHCVRSSFPIINTRPHLPYCSDHRGRGSEKLHFYRLIAASTLYWTWGSSPRLKLPSGVYIYINWNICLPPLPMGKRGNEPFGGGGGRKNQHMKQKGKRGKIMEINRLKCMHNGLNNDKKCTRCTIFITGREK